MLKIVTNFVWSNKLTANRSVVAHHESIVEQAEFTIRKLSPSPSFEAEGFQEVMYSFRNEQCLNGLVFEKKRILEGLQFSFFCLAWSLSSLGSI